MVVLAFRWLVVGCQAATIVITWPLWRVHETPPMLPALALPALSLGPALLVSLALVLVRATGGTVLHSGLLVYAMLIDQTRIQPEIVSLALLLWGTLPSPDARLVGRTHLIALWSWAGLNKLLSPVFLETAGYGPLAVLVPRALSWIRPAGGYLLAVAELAIGLLLIAPRTRRVGAVLALVLHGGIVIAMARVGPRWNLAVWPWNVALACAGLALIAPWKQPFRESVARSRPLVRVIVVLLLVAPAGWFVGLTDAYLAHHLYSADMPRAVYRGFAATWKVRAPGHAERGFRSKPNTDSDPSRTPIPGRSNTLTG
jgi:hypothetical protein